MSRAISDLDSLLVEKGRTIFREGDLGYCAYLIERGQAEVSVHRAGQQVGVARLGPGEIFGEMAIIDDKPRSATVTALEQCQLLLITREQLVRRVDDCDPILRMCLNVLLDRFRATMKRIQAIEGDLGVPQAGPQTGPDSADDPKPAYDQAIQEILLEREIEKAIHQEDFELHFQPIVSLESGAIAGFESLVRWRHSARGLLSPLVFIPTAEASGLIVPLGRWCFREACRALPELGPAGETFVSVNVSGRDFGDPRFVDHIEAALAETGADPGRVKLEITESLLMRQPDRAIAALHDCRIKGLSIAIDDFGTGYSSLSYLHRFPVDTLKIDRSFVQSLHDGNPGGGSPGGGSNVGGGREIIVSILGLARQLGIPVVAEGIESERDVAVLRELGCPFGQGYLFAKPQDLAATRNLAARWQAGRTAGEALREAV